MNASAHKKYLLALAAFTLLCLLITAAFNAVVDPFRVFDIVTIRGVNESRCRAVHNLRTTLAYRARRVRPRALALGSSRMARRAFCGRMARDPGGAPCMSLPIPQCTAYENLRYFEHANRIRRVRRVVWGLDFPSFNNNRPRTMPGFREDRLTAHPAADILSLLISRDAARESLLTLRQNDTSSQYALMRDVLANIGEPSPRRVIDVYEHNTTFNFLFGLSVQGLLPPPARAFSSSENDAMMRSLKKLLAEAAQGDTEVKLFFSPDHAYIAQTYDYLGLEDDYEQWMRSVARIADHARRNGARVSLWDFSGCNSITADPVPPGDRAAPMKYHYDISHYRNNAAALIMDVMRNRDTAARRAHPDFGVRVTSDNIEARIKQNRVQCAAYAKKHADELEPLRKKLLNKINRTSGTKFK